MNLDKCSIVKAELRDVVFG
ncbi:hypothetical protein LINPERHAP1_LOCUS40519 [Linum perenne]